MEVVDEKFKSMKPVIRIDVVSDVVCPWCYIGKRRLEKAIDALVDHYEFDVVYHPFELNPNIPKEGINQAAYLTDKFGGEERYDQLTGHVTSIAADEGIKFDFAKQAISPNTRDAHRIIHLAAESGSQKAAVEAFFKAYFTDGIDLSKPENLIAIGVQAGLRKEAIETFLATGEAEAEVILAENEMQEQGVRGVPFYIINNKYGVSGAQQSKTFIDAFRQIGNEMLTSGESCDADAKNC